MVRPSCSDKLNVKKGLWTPEEDVKMSAYVSEHGTGNCTAAPKKPGLRRCGKSCRLRRTNCQRPDPKHDSFTPQEEELIVRLHAAIGSRWFIIAQQLPGRTDNDVKNYWNTKLRKKLSEMGIDPVTHKPFSQILADYGNIGCLLEYGTRIGSLNRDLKTAFISKPEPPFASTPQPIPNIDTQLATTSLLPPKLEPIQECLFNTTKFSEDDPVSNQSLDLLDQLQAIKLVREASSCSNLSSSSSSSSSSSICSSSAQEKSALSFSWRDFLLDDAFPPSDHPQEQENVTVEDQQNVIPQDQIHGSVQGIDLAINPARSGFQVPSSCQSQTSFVEAMLDQENEIFFDFPNLLEEPFSY